MGGGVLVPLIGREVASTQSPFSFPSTPRKLKVLVLAEIFCLFLLLSEEIRPELFLPAQSLHTLLLFCHFSVDFMIHAIEIQLRKLIAGEICMPELCLLRQEVCLRNQTVLDDLIFGKCNGIYHPFFCIVNSERLRANHTRMMSH